MCSISEENTYVIYNGVEYLLFIGKYFNKKLFFDKIKLKEFIFKGKTSLILGNPEIKKFMVEDSLDLSISDQFDRMNYDQFLHYIHKRIQLKFYD